MKTTEPVRYVPYLWWAVALALLLLDSLLVLMFAVAQSSDTGSVRSVFAIGMLIALAAAAVGGLVGLLFGVPRALAQSGDGSSNPRSPEPSTKAATASVSGYATNTNLEQVSDWLTKILLGAGLTQLGRVPDAFSDLADYLAPGLGRCAAAEPFAVALITTNLVLGFVIGYLLTSLKLGAALLRADKLSQESRDVHFDLGKLSTSSPGEKLPLPVAQTKVERELALQLSRRMLDVEAATAQPVFELAEYRRLAKRLIQQKLYDEAVRILEAAAKQYPDDPRSLAFAGAIRSAYLNDYIGAEQLYIRALNINPNFADAFYNLACNEARQRHDKETVHKYLEKAFELDPRLRDFAKQDTEVWNEFRDSAGQSYLESYLQKEMASAKA